SSPWRRSMARFAASGDTSLSTVGRPESANISAISEPIIPAPTTPILPNSVKISPLDCELARARRIGATPRSRGIGGRASHRLDGNSGAANVQAHKELCGLRIAPADGVHEQEMLRIGKRQAVLGEGFLHELSAEVLRAVPEPFDHREELRHTRTRVRAEVKFTIELNVVFERGNALQIAHRRVKGVDVGAHEARHA